MDCKYRLQSKITALITSDCGSSMARIHFGIAAAMQADTAWMGQSIEVLERLIATQVRAACCSISHGDQQALRSSLAPRRQPSPHRSNVPAA